MAPPRKTTPTAPCRRRRRRCRHRRRSRPCPANLPGQDRHADLEQRAAGWITAAAAAEEPRPPRRRITHAANGRSTISRPSPVDIRWPQRPDARTCRRPTGRATIHAMVCRPSKARAAAPHPDSDARAGERSRRPARQRRKRYLGRAAAVRAKGRAAGSVLTRTAKFSSAEMPPTAAAAAAAAVRAKAGWRRWGRRPRHCGPEPNHQSAGSQSAHRR